VDIEGKEELTVKTMHVEYTLLRAEIRLNWVLVMCCIFAAVSVPFIGLMISGFLSQTYGIITLLVSSALSIFFTLLGMVLLGIIVNLALRLTEIEEHFNSILGENVIRWEIYAGLFPKIGEDIMLTSVIKYIYRCGTLCFIVGIVPVSVNLWQGFDILQKTIGDIVLLPMVVFAAIIGFTIYTGYRFWYKKDWERMKI
jgi:hypothetical protein